MKEWKLTRGGDVLALLHQDGREQHVDHQAVEAAYQLTPAFEPLRPLFEREAELLEIDCETDNTEWAEIWEELHAPGLFIESPGGRIRIAILWIHFKDNRAWWFPLYNDPQTKIPPLPESGQEE